MIGEITPKIEKNNLNVETIEETAESEASEEEEKEEKEEIPTGLK